MDSLLKEIRYANGATLTASYDLVGNLLNETDPEGNATDYEYDPVGRMTAVTDALGNTTRYEYDAADNLAKVTDALGHVTSYTYDALGNLTSETDALGNTVKYSYTTEGWLETVTDAEGHVTRYTYDRTGNILTADYAGEQTETNTYNELGLLTTVTTAEGDTLYQYDDASRLISVTQPNGETVSYTYDSHGNRATMTYPNGKTVKYTYDDMNRLVSVKGVDGATTKYEYDALGRRIATDGAKEDTVYAYDEVGNLVSQTTTGAYDLALEYAYDLSGRMTQESRTENGVTLESVFTYDPLGQLTSFTRSDGQSETYTYDPVGNMTAKTKNGVSTTMRYNAANQLIQSVTGNDTTKYTYDANGNLTRSENAGGARSYAYNVLNLLQSFTREDGYTETYTYNANRLLSTIKTSEDLTTTLTWDILYGDGVVISAAQNGQQTSYTHGLERISAQTGNTRTEYVYDGRGSVAAEVSYNDAWYTFGGGLARKNVVSKSYSPFGELLTEQTSGFGYNGEYYNAATGMIYLRARFYEPEMNRFRQKDLLRGSITNPISLNRYLYCQSDPVNFADYNGLQMVNVCVADGGGGGRDNSRYARTTASSTTASNQPPTFREYLAQNNYDPFNPLGRLSTAGDITGRQGYSCGNGNTANGQTTIDLTNAIANYDVEVEDGWRIVGGGVQVDVNAGISGLWLQGDIGAELVIYKDEKVIENTYPGASFIVAGYYYFGGDISSNPLLGTNSIQYLFNDEAVHRAIMDISNGLGQSNMPLSGSGSLSVFVVLGNENFNSPETYTNGFQTASITVNHVRAYGSWAPDAISVGIGGSTSAYSVDYSATNYSLFKDSVLPFGIPDDGYFDELEGAFR